MKTIIRILTLFCLGTAALQAQKPQAIGGPYGVFIQIDKLLHGPQYVIERLETGKNKPEWQPVCTTGKGPANAAELTARLTVLAAKNPLYQLPNDSLTTLLFDRYRNVAHADSLGGYGSNPQYLEALGLGFLDTGVQQGLRYDYRLRALGAREGVYHNPGTVSVPGAKLATTARSVSRHTDGRTVSIQYLIKKPNPYIAGARVLRAAFGQTGFEECGAEWGFRKGERDSLFLVVTDPNVRRKMLYSYVVYLQDFVGNESAASDTLTLANLRAQDEIPVIHRISTRSVESDNAITVSWELSSVKDLRAVEIWRSEDFDTGFKRVGVAAATDTAYTDHAVEPVQGYYYQVRLNGTYESSPASVKVSGMLKANRPALLAPAHFQLTETQDSLTFRWEAADFDTHGYYIYFAAGQTDTLQQFSDMIPAHAALKYQIPVQKLAIGVAYRWAVVAVNTSYNQGPMSNELYSEPRFPTRLATPLNPELIDQPGNAWLVWENMKAIDPYTLGYIIERKAENEKAFKEIYRQHAEDQARNHYADSTVKQGVHYSYRIRAYGMGGRLSAFSTEIGYYQPHDAVLPVHGLNVATTNRGVLVSWDAPLAKPDKYLVYRYTEKTEKPRLVSAPLGTQTGYIDRDAVAGVGYYYHVVAVGTDNRESAPTDPVKVDWK
ncbi:hypothetical protein GCM10010967_31990 [Dyadobacter beijingensis]|uniref:Fibronectin type-III domain-containing protein n=1 Tax=Dyadobacter beijingensis TaxID=365489 RepID=A0ABQ2HZB4_9BACT|nr:fibronectin type III domain-containing protein [Dyadobacter beijingensis]GGM96062.1 hypothetical protein GCM10010967_31990 [Dyadobacter beijingensis]